VQVRAPGTARAGDEFHAGVVAQVHDGSLLRQYIVTNLTILTPDLVSCSPCVDPRKPSCNVCSIKRSAKLLDEDNDLLFKFTVHRQFAGLAQVKVFSKVNQTTVSGLWRCVACFAWGC
jgi:hypothetical protein